MADKKTIAESLGLPADASEDDILAKTREALGIKDEPKPDESKTDDPASKVENPPAPMVTPTVDQGAPEVAAAAARAKANGEVVELDKATYEQMMANAALGAKAHATLTAQAHAQVVDKAIDEGRITPARRDHYMSLMTADTADTTDLLTKRLQAGAAVPLHEIGHMAEMSAKNHDDPAEDPKFKLWKV